MHIISIKLPSGDEMKYVPYQRYMVDSYTIKDGVKIVTKDAMEMMDYMVLSWNSLMKGKIEHMFMRVGSEMFDRVVEKHGVYDRKVHIPLLPYQFYNKENEQI